MAGALLSTILVAACAGDGEGSTDPDDSPSPSPELDYTAIGLWDDGPCDEARPPLVVGLMTVFESAGLSLGDQATALEAAAEAFNARGGANGACIEVHTCDDRSNADQSLECVQEIDEAGVVATVNDQGTQALIEVSAAMAEAGIPRVANTPNPDDWTDPNTYPLDAAGTGFTFLSPRTLLDSGVSDIGVIRVDIARAAALVGLLTDIYDDEGATFPVDVPVPATTTDYTQFVQATEEGGASGAVLALGPQEAVQVVRAGQQLDSELLFGATLGNFSRSSVADLDEEAERLVFTWAYPPASFDLPVYAALREDLAASDDEELQPENLRASPLRSWIGLYALLWMIRDVGMTEFTRDGITEMLQTATDVPMLGIFGGEDWTPNHVHPGVFQRAGVNHWGIYRWDPDAGDFIESGIIDFDEVLCGSPFGAPPPC